MAKLFNGQGKDEKVLYYTKEFYLSYFFNNFMNLLTVLGGLLLFSYLFLMFEVGFVYIIILWLVILMLSFGYVYLFWNGTYLIVTNKRILKFVKDGFFSSHYKEMKLDALQEKVGKIGGFMGKIFDYGDISLRGKDESNVIWFRGVKSPKEVTMYVSRLKEFIVENPDYDISKLNEFKSRKERYKDKEVISNSESGS